MGLVTTAEIGRVVKHFVANNESYEILDANGGGTWSAGGCYLLAFALHKKFKLPLYALFGSNRPNGMICNQHVVVKSGQFFIDADGTQAKQSLLRRWSKEEGFSGIIVPYDPAGDCDPVICSRRNIARVIKMLGA